MQQQHVSKILKCARAFLEHSSSHTSSAPRRGRSLAGPALQSLVPKFNKYSLRVPCIPRHCSSRFRGIPSYSRPKCLARVPGATFEIGRIPSIIVGVVSAAGSLSQAECYSEIAICESDESSGGLPPNEVAEWDHRRSRWVRIIRWLWVPSLCVLTISLSWQYPLSLLINLVFLMWTTKPTPASIYIWVEEMRQQEVLKFRPLDRMKAQAAGVMHVEVHDNILFCLARVSSLTKRSTLVGVLGDWWVVSSSSSAFHTGLKLKNLLPTLGPFPWERRYA